MATSNNNTQSKMISSLPVQDSLNTLFIPLDTSHEALMSQLQSSILHKPCQDTLIPSVMGTMD